MHTLDKRHISYLAALCTLIAGAPGVVGAQPMGFGTVRPPGWVDAHRLKDAKRERGQWFTVGRDAGQTFYSPLAAINQSNVRRLGFAWQYKLGTQRGLEATPIVVDGVMYTSGPWGYVYALDAASGKLLWSFNPHVPGGYGKYPCCDVVNRGVAVWKGRVYVTSVNGFLDSIDARTGKLVWQTQTLPLHAPGSHYYVSGAPVVAGRYIVIGYGGADFAGSRGSVSAYSLASGKLEWRFYTVPRDPKLGPQSDHHLRSAVATWPKDFDWKMGGGGAVWDGFAYDSKLHLVYFGTANAAPYHGQIDPKKYGDEHYVASIIAVHVRTGRMAWFYQEVPGDGFDYDACNPLVLTEIRDHGRERRVIMQASKDGFLYVLDRATGKLLSAKPFMYVNWTKGIDPKSGRPIPRLSVDWTHSAALVWPNGFGGHNWQPMSFDPKTGLIYIPVDDSPMVYVNTQHARAGMVKGSFDLGYFFPQDYSPQGLRSLYGDLPPLKALARGGPPPISRGYIRAIEPITGRVVWQHRTASFWDGGILSTGGDLVIQGDADGYLSAYSATSGRLLKQIDVGTSIMAAPMTYRVQGVQYVSVMAGYGGGMLYRPFPKSSAAYRFGNQGRILTFRLGGGPTPVPSRFRAAPLPILPARRGSAQEIAHGEVLYNRFCSRCHTFGRALLPDLRRSSAALSSAIYSIVLHGALQSQGMGRFDNDLTHADVKAIHAYIIDQAWQMRLADRASAAR